MRRTERAVRRDISAAVLRQKARSETDGHVASRLFGIANILDGMDRESAARPAGMTRHTLRDGVHRDNAHGIEGLRDRAKGHATRGLTPEPDKELEPLVLPGPEGTLVRWRVELREVITDRRGVASPERSVGNILPRLNVSRVSPRPLPPEADLDAQQALKKTSRPRSPKSFRSPPRDKSSKSGFRTKRGSDRKAP